MKAYVINLPKDTDRKVYMQKILKEQNINDVFFINAVYGKNLSLQEKEQLFDIKKFTAKYAKIPNDAQIGCALSHRKCYEEFLKTHEPYCLILEDDIVPKSLVLPVIKEIQGFLETVNYPAIVLLSGWFWYINKLRFHSTSLGKLYSGFLKYFKFQYVLLSS